jgi:protein-disulfide isomerase-like protein with CxxC motif
MMDLSKECSLCFGAGFLVDKVSLFPVAIGFIMGNLFSETFGKTLKTTFAPLMDFAAIKLKDLKRSAQDKSHGE